MTLTAVVMPAYNEAGGIADFVHELVASFSDDVLVVVCDDCSTDGTLAAVRELEAGGLPVRAVPGEVNAGHGPTTLRALREGIASGADVVVAVDGDGQFRGDQVAHLADVVRSGTDVVEGVRVSRSQPTFRHVTTQGTRLLVWVKTRTLPRDANTPLRAYRAGTLAKLLPQVPAQALTPNLHMSTLVRSSEITYQEVVVEWLPRRADPTSSTTFGVSRMWPSRRFVAFCARAVREWARGAR